MNINAIINSLIMFFNDTSNRISTTFTLISVVISALISICISRHYYKKENRDSVEASILLPISKLLKQQSTSQDIKPEVYFEIRRLAESYTVRYLKKSERAVLNELLDSMDAVRKRSARDRYVISIVACLEAAMRDRGFKLTYMYDPKEYNYTDEIAYCYPDHVGVAKMGVAPHHPVATMPESTPAA